MQDEGIGGNSKELLVSRAFATDLSFLSSLFLFASTKPRLGLKRDDADRWTDLLDEIRFMNSGGGSTYKLLLVGRHGEGWRESHKAIALYVSSQLPFIIRQPRRSKIRVRCELVHLVICM